MSAATAPHVDRPATAGQRPPVPPAQLGLAGVPAAEPGIRVAIVGHLQRRAELRISTDGRAHLTVQVLQPRDGLPFVAMQHEQAEPSVTRADLEHLARTLQPGTAVIVTGQGLQLAEHEGERVLRLLRCNGLCVADPQVFFAPPRAAAEAHPGPAPC